MARDGDHAGSSQNRPSAEHVVTWTALASLAATSITQISSFPPRLLDIVAFISRDCLLG